MLFIGVVITVRKFFLNDCYRMLSLVSVKNIALVLPNAVRFHQMAKYNDTRHYIEQSKVLAFWPPELVVHTYKTLTRQNEF